MDTTEDFSPYRVDGKLASALPLHSSRLFYSYVTDSLSRSSTASSAS